MVRVGGSASMKSPRWVRRWGTFGAIVFAFGGALPSFGARAAAAATPQLTARAVSH